MVEQFRDNLASIDVYFADQGLPGPASWVRIDSEGSWSEVGEDSAREYMSGTSAIAHGQLKSRVMRGLKFLEEKFAPRAGADIPVEYFILELCNEYVLAIRAIERQDWETALFKTFQAGWLKQMIDDRHQLANVKTGSKIRRGLRYRRDLQNQNSARAVELRRGLIRGLLMKTKLKGGALVDHLAEQTGASLRTIQRDLRAIL